MVATRLHFTPPPSLASPLSLTKTPSSASTLVDDIVPSKTYAPADENIDKLEQVFRLHDLLIKDTKSSKEFPFTNIVSVGGQSAGKSSVLSMISGVPLYSATDTATICPLQIHSRKGPVYSARIEIELVQLDGSIIRRPFTASPIAKDDIALATRMAGYQARSCQGVAEEIESYESLMAMTSKAREAWLEAQKKVRGWTDATVILHQANVSIIDLPGLMSGPKGQVTRDLIENHINKETGSHNLILVCCAGSGDDITLGHPILELVRKHDPKGARTMGLITKCDLVQDASSIGRLVLNTNPDFDWKPAHGWWPISAKDAKENKNNTSEIDIRNREIALFRDDTDDAGWKDLQAKAGRRSGTQPVRAKVYDVFQKMVMKRMKHDLAKQIQNQVSSTDAAIGQLPPEEVDPVGKLHTTIHDIWQRLSRAILTESVYTRKLHDAQKQLDLDLAKQLPVFFPFRASENPQYETYDAPMLHAWDGSGSIAHIYLEETIDIVREFTSARDESFDFARARTALIKRFAGPWHDICKTHVDSVWVIVEEAMTEVVGFICGTKEDLKARLILSLSDRGSVLKGETLDLIEKLCRRELQDPMLIDVLNEYTTLDYDTCIKNFRDRDQAKTNSSKKGRSATRTPLSSAADGPINDTSRHLPDDPISPEELERCFSLMASVTSWLVRGSTRTASTVGRETQGQVVDFLDEVIPTLRKGLGLEEVAVNVLTKSGQMLEPDVAIVEKRQLLGKRKRELEEMRERFSKVFDKQ